MTTTDRALEAVIAELLHAGCTYPQIRTAIPRADYNTIAAVRRAHRIPVPDRHPRGRAPEETYAHYATPTTDGHTHWTGPWSGRMPMIWLPRSGNRKTSALRVAFRMRHHRDPIGYVRPICGDPHCCASADLADRPMRHTLTNPENT